MSTIQYTSIKELVQIYSAADIFLNLTYCDSYGLVNLEAALCGTPIVSYDTGGCCESVGDNGILINKGDLDALINILNSFQYNDVRENISVKKYDLKRFRKETLDLYRGGYWKAKVKYNLIGKSVILGVAAIWDERKGLDSLIQLSKILDDNYRIIIVGLSEEQVSQIPSNIYVVKATNDVEELAELYAIADYFVNPTYEDNYPTTNLEAISCGTPVLTYNTGGSPESALLYGKVFAQGNIKAIAGQIRSSEIIKKESMNIDKNTAVAKYLEIFRV